MLMTVLKGEQATAQSKALIRLFKQMKDYIAAENAPDVSARMVALATQTSQNTRDIAHCSRNCCKTHQIAVFNEISSNTYKTSSNSWHFLEKDCQIRGILKKSDRRIPPDAFILGDPRLRGDDKRKAGMTALFLKKRQYTLLTLQPFL